MGHNQLSPGHRLWGPWLLVGAVAFAILAVLVFSHGDAQADSGPVSAAQTLATGRTHSCVIASDGTVACWGGDDVGQATPLGEEFVQITAGSDHACGLRPSGAVECWGHNSHGQSSPSGGGFLQISAGYVHTCGVASSGVVSCWGYDASGQSSPPSGDFSLVRSGAHFTCGLRSSGSIECWGAELQDHQGVSVGMEFVGRYTQIAAGLAHMCAIDADGMVECWGYNEYGQASPPSGKFRQISAGRIHTCGVTDAGVASCWGADGQNQASSPSGAFNQVSAGQYHTCGLRPSGAVTCWGRRTGSSGTNVPDRFQRAGAALLPSASGIEIEPSGSGRLSAYHVITAARLSGPTGGTVASAPAGLEGNSGVTLTATPDDGYRFVRWEGDASGTENPLALTPSSHVFVTAIFEPIDSDDSGPPTGPIRRARLFASRTLPAQTWQVGQPVSLTLPAATSGSGVYSYSIKYEWNGDQTWTPTGIGFDRNIRTFSGAPRMPLDSNPDLHRFTVFLRVDDRIRTGEWDELAFVVNLTPAPTGTPALPAPTPSDPSETPSDPTQPSTPGERRDPVTTAPSDAPSQFLRVQVKARYHDSTEHIELRLITLKDGKKQELKHRLDSDRRVAKSSLSDGEWRTIACLPVSNWNCVSPMVRLRNGRYQFAVQHLSSESTLGPPNASFTISDFEREPLLSHNWKETGSVSIRGLRGTLYQAGTETVEQALFKSLVQNQLPRASTASAAYSDYQAAAAIIDDVDAVKEIGGLAAWTLKLIKYSSSEHALHALLEWTSDRAIEVALDHVCKKGNGNGYVAPDAYVFVFQQIKSHVDVMSEAIKQWNAYGARLADDGIVLTYDDAAEVARAKLLLEGIAPATRDVLTSSGATDALSIVQLRNFGNLFGSFFKCLDQLAVSNRAVMAALEASSDADFDRRLREEWAWYGDYMRSVRWDSDINNALP